MISLRPPESRSWRTTSAMSLRAAAVGMSSRANRGRQVRVLQFHCSSLGYRLGPKVSSFSESQRDPPGRSKTLAGRW